MLVLLLSGCRDYNELNMQELEKYSGSLGWIDVCKYE